MLPSLRPGIPSSRPPVPFPRLQALSPRPQVSAGFPQFPLLHPRFSAHLPGSGLLRKQAAVHLPGSVPLRKQAAAGWRLFPPAPDGGAKDLPPVLPRLPVWSFHFPRSPAAQEQAFLPERRSPAGREQEEPPVLPAFFFLHQWTPAPAEAEQDSVPALPFWLLPERFHPEQKTDCFPARLLTRLSGWRHQRRSGPAPQRSGQKPAPRWRR